MKDKTTPEDLLHEDGENNAVRMFLAAYGCGSPSIKAMKDHLECCGYPFWPEWAEKYEDTTHLTKGGAQSWIRHLFALEPEAVRAKACVDLCAGSSDAVIKDITDALRAYEVTLDQHFLESDAKYQEIMKVLGESKGHVDTAIKLEQVSKAMFCSITTAIHYLKHCDNKTAAIEELEIALKKVDEL